ncbi:peroxidase [Chrysoperla carnea]|uniref:peroxidase n=1 Tax=Chrysoperla carnea TaxID=189513 RepID=UPI001D0779BA|nr:peroxidase [Chrysoperla carnea]
MDGCNPVLTPMEKLTAQGPGKAPDFPYRSAVGALLYVARGTRYDIAFSVSVLSRHLANPTEEDVVRAKRVIRYLAGTINLKSVYQCEPKTRVLECYSDADFAGCPNTMHSTSGVIVKFAGAAITWLSRRQELVADSTCEAEIVAANLGSKETIWISRLFKELIGLSAVPVLRIDNEMYKMATKLLLLSFAITSSKYFVTAQVYVQQSTPHFKYSLFGGGAGGLSELAGHGSIFNRRTPTPPLTTQTSPFGLSEPAGYFTSAAFSGGVNTVDYGPPPQEPVDTNPNRCGVQAPACLKSRYRTYDGSCNNLRNPIWGTTNSSYVRLLPAKYGDGISTPTDAGNQDYPLPRIVSIVLFPTGERQDPKWTLAAMQYGQIITHDMAMIAGSTQISAHPINCCTDDGQLLPRSALHNQCYPIIIPANDPVFTDRQCNNFVRTITDLSRGCLSEIRQAEQLTAVTSFLDAHLIYGQSVQQNAQLRAFVGGRLLVEDDRGRQFPPSAMNKTAVCDIQSELDVCFASGDVRINQNPQLALLHTIMLREHNRIADYLQKINPQWPDELTFQEARRILIAEHQAITYNEWLPIFLGKDNVLQHRIIYQTNQHVDDYNENINPSILNEHSTAAFRYFHSAIAGQLALVSPHRNAARSIRLSDWFDRPSVVVENFDDLTRGLASQPEEENDVIFNAEIKNYLFRGNNILGQDLRSIDIQRNRDHGLASYNDYRQFCGLPRAQTFEGFLDLISKDNVEKLASLYKTPDHVDLTVGGSLEAHVPGALAGPTFICIMTEQFFRTRVGDRYWYENPNAGFTVEQVNELRKSSISRWFCDNGDAIKIMQPRGFEVISADNPLLHCEELPSVNLDLWKDISGAPVPGQSNLHDEFYFKKK